MRYKEFYNFMTPMWSRYLSAIQEHIDIGTVSPIDSTFRMYFPDTILITQTPDHYIAELTGAKERFEGLKLVKNRATSAERYFFQFTLDDIVGFAATITYGGSGLLNTVYVGGRDQKQKATERFPHLKIDELGEYNITYERPGAIPFSFLIGCGPNAFNNVLVVNSKNNIYRCKEIINSVTVSTMYSLEEFENEWTEILGEPLYKNVFPPLGVTYGSIASGQKRIISGQFVNMFLSGIKEPSIGTFIQKNPEIITTGLGCESFLYEKSFDWIEGNPDPEEKYIQPDLMLKRKDGYYDICDLKLPRLDKKLTRGQRKRRGFVADVEDGINQLANYEDYFTFEKNREHAFKRYGVKLQDPKLYLVVGNYENANKEEIAEASRKLNRVSEKYIIIDYDTLNALYLRSAA